MLWQKILDEYEKARYFLKNFKGETKERKYNKSSKESSTV